MSDDLRDPQRRPRSEEFVSFLHDIASEIEQHVDGALSAPPPEPPSPEEDDRLVREWPDVTDRMIEDLR